MFARGWRRPGGAVCFMWIGAPAPPRPPTAHCNFISCRSDNQSHQHIKALGDPKSHARCVKTHIPTLFQPSGAFYPPPVGLRRPRCWWGFPRLPVLERQSGERREEIRRALICGGRFDGVSHLLSINRAPASGEGRRAPGGGGGEEGEEEEEEEEEEGGIEGGGGGRGEEEEEEEE